MKSLKIFLASLLIVALSTSLYAKSAAEIDQEANAAIQQFNKEVKNSSDFLNNTAKGILIFPKVIKAGIGIGGEYGEGVLRVNGKSVQYYSTASASIGFQLGAQQKSILIAFLTDEALEQFRKSNGWKVGVDGSVALINLGVGKDISSATLNKPVVGFIFGSKGLMYNLTLEGSKFTKIVR
jgi:lipid-binding SYLF domain-containing protein